MIESRMAKPFMCQLMSEAIEAIVKVKRKNDSNFFKDCAMAMWIVMAFFLFIHWLVSQRLRDPKAETQTVCLRIVYADKEKSSYENS